MRSLKEKILSEPRAKNIQGEEEEKEMGTQKGWPNIESDWVPSKDQGSTAF